MNIEVKIRRIYHDKPIRALASITLDRFIAVHNIKIIETPGRLFVAMPSRRGDKGTFRDIVHPINSTARQEIEDAVITAYYDVVGRVAIQKESGANTLTASVREEKGVVNDG